MIFPGVRHQCWLNRVALYLKLSFFRSAESKPSVLYGSSNKRSTRGRRERDDRDAKRKERSRGSKSPKPGAIRSERKHHRSGDDKAANRRERGSSESDPMGSPSGRSRKSRDEKSASRKERSGDRAVAPGAQSSQKDRATRKAVRSRRKKSSTDESGGDNNDVSVDDGATKEVGPDGEPVLQAMIVEDVEDDLKKKENKSNIRELVQGETNKRAQQKGAHDLVERQAIEKENERLRKEAEGRARMDEKKKRRNKLIVVVIVICSLGGGLGAFFALQGGTSDDQSDVGLTEVPLPASNNPSSNPTTSNPTSSPTEFLDYGPPTLDECERISAGYAVSISDDGSVLAVGSYGANTKKGYVKVYASNGSNWIQVGSRLDGEATVEHFGYYLAMSSDGSVVAGLMMVASVVTMAMSAFLG